MPRPHSPCRRSFLEKAAAAGLVLSLGPHVRRPGVALAQDSAGKIKPELPPDQALLAKIAALADNTWLKLPQTKTAGELAWATGDVGDYARSGPTVRDYCNKMVWAPERRRALYCGAGHNIHPWNDVWEYDLAANTWICLYAPEPGPPPSEAGGKEVVNWYRENFQYRDGVLSTRKGAPVRPAHTWWGLCYDTERRRMVFWDAHKGQLFSDRVLNTELLLQALGLKADHPAVRLSGSGPGEAWIFTFSPGEAAWKEVITGAPKAYESSQIEYLMDRQKFWLHSGRTYQSDASLRHWKLAGQGGPGQGVVSAYDSETRTVVAAGSKAWVYSCDRDRWMEKAAVPEGDGGYIPNSIMSFDSVAKYFVLFTWLEVAGKNLPPVRLWLYSLKQDRWFRPVPQGDVPLLEPYTGYYDLERNVSVYCNSHGEVWVYRFQNGK